METSRDAFKDPQKGMDSENPAVIAGKKKQKKSAAVPARKYLYRIYFNHQYFWTISASSAPDRILSGIQSQAARKPLQEFSRFIQSGISFKEEAEITEVTSVRAEDEGSLSNVLVADIRDTCAQIRQNGSRQGIVRHKISQLFRYFLKDSSRPLEERIENLKEQVIRLSRWIDFDLPDPGYLALLLELESGSKADLQNKQQPDTVQSAEYASEPSPFSMLARAVFQPGKEMSPDWYWKAWKPGSKRRAPLFFGDFISQELLVGQEGEAAWFYPEFSLASVLETLPVQEKGRLYAVQLDAFMDWESIKKLNVAAMPSRLPDSDDQHSGCQEEETGAGWSLTANTAKTLAALYPDQVHDLTAAITDFLDTDQQNSSLPGLQQSAAISKNETQKPPESQEPDTGTARFSEPSGEATPKDVQDGWRKTDLLLILAANDDEPARFTRLRARLKKAGYSRICFYVLNGQKSKVLRRADHPDDGGFDPGQMERMLQEDQKSRPAGPFDLFVISPQHVLGFYSPETKDFIVYSRKLEEFFKSRKEQCILYVPDQSIQAWLEQSSASENPCWLASLPKAEDSSQLRDLISFFQKPKTAPERVLALGADESLIQDFGAQNLSCAFVQWGNRYQDLPTQADLLFDMPDQLQAFLEDEQQESEIAGS